MTVTYDPLDAAYLDEADVRNELSRVFAVCDGCRRCVDLCEPFPTLVALLDRVTDRDPGRLTPAEQDRVLDGCIQCSRCVLQCPYAPGRDDLQVDVFRLVERAAAMRVDTGQLPIRSRAATKVMARTDRMGSLATAATAATNSWVTARPGSVRRRTLAALTGASPVRMLPPFARQRFSAWFRRRGRRADAGAADVVVFPTCFVEYQEPAIGKDLVAVYEHHALTCASSDAGCCGAPWLQAGDVTQFAKVARRNVGVLARELRGGAPLVVPQPTCAMVLRHDYTRHVPGEDAELVASRTRDAAEHLLELHAAGLLDTRFPGDVPDSVTYHLACHTRAQDIGAPGRDLVALTGATVRLVTECAGTGALVGLRRDREGAAAPLAARLGAGMAAGTAAVGDADTGAAMVGDCHLANTAIREHTGVTPMHPIQVLARAYGIPERP
jgi:Fe-S oxidoreductase